MTIYRSQDTTPENLEREMKEIAKRNGFKSIEEAFYFPKYFQIETVRLCNAECDFCGILDWDKSTPFMSDFLFEKIAHELHKYAHWIEKVTIQRSGEPLLDKKIGPRIKRLKDAGIKIISCSTNASMLTREKSTEILEAGLDEIMLSIDFIDKVNYEKTRKGLRYETVMENIKTFFEVRDQIKPNMSIRVRGVALNDLSPIDQKKESFAWKSFWKKFQKSHDRIYKKPTHNWGNQVVIESSQLLDNELNSADIFHPCIVPWSTFNITAMGKVPLCPQDYDAVMDLGDVNEENISNIWKNAKWDEVRRLHQNGSRNEIDFCRGCKIYDTEYVLEDKTSELGLI